MGAVVTLPGNVGPVNSIPTGVPGVSIETRPNGTFRVCWRAQGKQPRVTVESKRTALMLAKWLGKNGKDRLADDPALLFAIGRAPAPQVEDATVGVVLDRMLAETSPASLSTRRSQVKLLAPLHEVPVHRLTRTDVETWAEDLMTTGGPKGKGYAENTWRAAAGVLGSVLKPYGLQHLTKGYTGHARSKRVRQPVLMTRAEMDGLVWLGHDHGIGVLLSLLTDLGLRFGEATALRGTHVERIMGHPTVLVREQHPAKRGATTDNPHPAPEALKSEASARDLPPTQRVLDLAADAGAGLLTTDPKLGGPWRHYEARLALARVSRAAIAEGIISRPVKFHDFRHSWGAHLLLGGVDIVTVSKLLGHSSPTITGDIYGHLTARGIDQVRDLLK